MITGAATKATEYCKQQRNSNRDNAITDVANETNKSNQRAVQLPEQDNDTLQQQSAPLNHINVLSILLSDSDSDAAEDSDDVEPPKSQQQESIRKLAPAAPRRNPSPTATQKDEVSEKQFSAATKTKQTGAFAKKNAKKRRKRAQSPEGSPQQQQQPASPVVTRSAKRSEHKGSAKRKTQSSQNAETLSDSDDEKELNRGKGKEREEPNKPSTRNKDPSNSSRTKTNAPLFDPIPKLPPPPSKGSAAMQATGEEPYSKGAKSSYQEGDSVRVTNKKSDRYGLLGIIAYQNSASNRRNQTVTIMALTPHGCVYSTKMDFRDLEEVEPLFTKEELINAPTYESKPEHFVFLRYQTKGYRKALFSDPTDGRSSQTFLDFLFKQSKSKAEELTFELHRGNDADVRQFQEAHNSDVLLPGTAIYVKQGRHLINAAGSKLNTRRGKIVATRLSQSHHSGYPQMFATIAIFDPKGNLRDFIQTEFVNFCINRQLHPRAPAGICHISKDRDVSNTATQHSRQPARRAETTSRAAHSKRMTPRQEVKCGNINCFRWVKNMVPVQPGEQGHNCCSQWCQDNQTYTSLNCFNGCEKPPASGKRGDKCETCLHLIHYETSSEACLPAKQSTPKTTSAEESIITPAPGHEVEFARKGKLLFGIVQAVNDSEQTATIACEELREIVVLAYNEIQNSMFPTYEYGPVSKAITHNSQVHSEKHQWHELKAHHRSALLILGWNKDNWTPSDSYPKIFDTQYADLTTKQKQATRALHITQIFFDARSSNGKVPRCTRPWAALVPDVAASAKYIGFTAKLWDAAEDFPLAFNIRWESLSRDVRWHAQNLHYTADTWNVISTDQRKLQDETPLEQYTLSDDEDINCTVSYTVKTGNHKGETVHLERHMSQVPKSQTATSQKRTKTSKQNAPQQLPKQNEKTSKNDTVKQLPFDDNIEGSQNSNNSSSSDETSDSDESEDDCPPNINLAKLSRSLPKKWNAKWSSRNKAIYYCNSKTKRTVWHEHDIPGTLRPKRKASSKKEKAHDVVDLSRTAAEQSQDAPPSAKKRKAQVAQKTTQLKENIEATTYDALAAAQDSKQEEAPTQTNLLS